MKYGMIVPLTMAVAGLVMCGVTGCSKEEAKAPAPVVAAPAAPAEVKKDVPAAVPAPAPEVKKEAPVAAPAAAPEVKKEAAAEAAPAADKPKDHPAH